MVLLFLHGLPGVGKLTVAREVEVLTGYPLFHNHLTVDLVATVFEFGSPAFVELREHIWLEVFARSADAKLPGLIFTFAGESTVADGFVERVVDTVESRGGEVVFAELDCSPEELRARVEDPGRRQFGKLASAALLETLIEDGTLYRLELSESLRQISVDNTTRRPENAAAEIMRQLHG